MPIHAIIFDCDGTLVDSEGLGIDVLLECLRHYGFPDVNDALGRFRGRQLAGCLAEVEQIAGRRLPAEFVGEFRRRSAEAFRQQLRPIDGAPEVVRACANRVPICVASSGPREKIALSLEITGLLPYFADRIFSSYEVGIWKPEPGLFLHAASTIGVAPEDCAVVEDSIPGIHAGIAAGMRVFALGDACGTLAHEVTPLNRLRELIDHLDGGT